MSRAVVMSWHREPPFTGLGYRALFEHFLQTLPKWAKDFDHLYMIDADMNFSTEDMRMVQKLQNTTFLKKELDGPAWIQYQWILPKIHEDEILFLDPAVIFTQSGIVASWFKLLENGADFVGSFNDNHNFKDALQNRFTFMKKHKISQLLPAYFLVKKELLDRMKVIDFAPKSFLDETYIPEIDYVTKPNDLLAPFSLFTIHMFAQNPKLSVIPYPEEKILLHPEMTDRGLRWKEKKTPEAPKNPGYYHIQNANFANYVISSKLAGNEEDYQEAINVDKSELLRSLAWFYHLLDYEGDSLIQILKDMGVRYRDFLVYFEEFEKYHQLV